MLAAAAAAAQLEQFERALPLFQQCAAAAQARGAPREAVLAVANEAAVWALVAEQAGRVGGDDACRSAAALAEQGCRCALAALQALGMSGAIVDVNGTLACALALAGHHDEACSRLDVTFR